MRVPHVIQRLSQTSYLKGLGMTAPSSADESLGGERSAQQHALVCGVAIGDGGGRAITALLKECARQIVCWPEVSLGCELISTLSPDASLNSGELAAVLLHDALTDEQPQSTALARLQLVGVELHAL